MESSIKVKIKLYYLYEYRKQVTEEVKRTLGELVKKVVRCEEVDAFIGYMV